jgi:hypothetical protein
LPALTTQQRYKPRQIPYNGLLEGMPICMRVFLSLVLVPLSIATTSEARKEVGLDINAVKLSIRAFKSHPWLKKAHEVYKLQNSINYLRMSNLLE